MNGWNTGHWPSPIRVLLVEAEPADAETVEMLLAQQTELPLDVTRVGSCEEAVALAGRAEVDVVIADLTLPDSTGSETAEAMLAAWPQTPVIVLTDWAEQRLGTLAVQSGCQDFLVKGSVDAELLQRTIRHAIECSATARALKESEERFRTLVEVSPDAILVCTADQVVFANAAALRIFAASSEELIGSDPLRLVGLANGLRLVAALGIEGEGGEPRPERFECELRRFDGKKFDAEMTLAAAVHRGQPAVELIIRDITGRKLAERRNRLAATVFQNADEAMMVTDKDNRIVAVNAAFERVTGYGADDAVGRDPHLLSSGRHDKAFYEAMWGTLLTTGHWHGEVWNRRKNGELYVQRLTLSLIRDSSGRVLNYVGIFDDITDEKQEAERIRYRAYYDALTGLPNRALLYDRILQAMAKTARGKSRLALLFLDLDGFKPVNDRYGHLTGDQVLMAVAERLQSCVRESDTVARLGGDEFVILLPEMGSPSDAPVVAAKILGTLAEPVQAGGVAINDLGASIGIALYPGDGDSVDGLLAAADKAMYRAKEGGKGHYVMATAGRAATSSAEPEEGPPTPPNG